MPEQFAYLILITEQVRRINLVSFILIESKNIIMEILKNSADSHIDFLKNSKWLHLQSTISNISITKQAEYSIWCLYPYFSAQGILDKYNIRKSNTFSFVIIEELTKMSSFYIFQGFGHGVKYSFLLKSKGST